MLIDNREEILSILRGITPNTFHCDVDDYKNNKYPKAVYILKDNYDVDYRDGEPYANIGEYIVQVYEKTVNGKLVEIHKEVLQAMKEAGYQKVFFDYMRDTEENLHLYTFRFKKYNLY